MNLRTAAVVIVAILCFPLPYLFHNWWRYVPETLLLLLAFRTTFRESWLARAGLQRDKLLAVAVLVPVTLLTCWQMPALTETAGLLPKPGSHYFWREVFSLFHAFNEELVFRALPLLAVPWSRAHRWQASVLAALVFAMAHIVFYPVALGGALSLPTFAALFGLGFGLNALCLARGTIAVSWAIHAGANIALFGRTDFTDVAGNALSSAQYFDTMLRQPQLQAAIGVLAVLGTASLLRSK